MKRLLKYPQTGADSSQFNLSQCAPSAGKRTRHRERTPSDVSLCVTEECWLNAKVLNDASHEKSPLNVPWQYTGSITSFSFSDLNSRKICFEFVSIKHQYFIISRRSECCLVISRERNTGGHICVCLRNESEPTAPFPRRDLQKAGN